MCTQAHGGLVGKGLSQVQIPTQSSLGKLHQPRVRHRGRADPDTPDSKKPTCQAELEPCVAVQSLQTSGASCNALALLPSPVDQRTHPEGAKTLEVLEPESAGHPFPPSSPLGKDSLPAPASGSAGKDLAFRPPLSQPAVGR